MYPLPPYNHITPWGEATILISLYPLSAFFRLHNPPGWAYYCSGDSISIVTFYFGGGLVESVGKKK